MPRPPMDPHVVAKQSKIIWAGLIVGYMGIACVFIGLIASGKAPSTDEALGRAILFVAAGLTVFQIPLGLFLRGQSFKAGWVGDVVTPEAYMKGNILAWAMCEAPGFLGLIGCFLAGSFWPYAIPPAVALLVLLLLYPNGRAMFPPRDRYATGER